MFPTGGTALASNQVGTAANRPAASAVPAGFLYYATDTNTLSESNGSTWTSIVAGGGVSGAGAWAVPVPTLISPSGAANVGTWAIAVDTASILCGYMRNSSNAQNDLWDVPNLQLDAGTYAFQEIAPTNNDAAIGTVLLDGSSVGTFDQYTATLTYNVVKTITGIVVATSGAHHLQVKAATKNASSSGFVLRLCSMQMIRTA